jgi:hypothetical protein
LEAYSEAPRRQNIRNHICRSFRRLFIMSRSLKMRFRGECGSYQIMIRHRATESRYIDNSIGR